MLIDTDLIRFCAEKTREIAADHDEYAIGGPFPRSAEDLHWLMLGRHGFPIHHKELRIPWKQAKWRSFYIPFGEEGAQITPGQGSAPVVIKECFIYYAGGMPRPHLRYYKTKELLQIHLWQEAHATKDIVDLVRNMIIRESPTSIDLDLGHSTTSDTLGEIAAMEFLFPLARRLEILERPPGNDGIEKLAADYEIPPFVVQRALNTANSLREFFCDGCERRATP
jgi:hypothetical protein